jgi:hypothetical protein
MLAEPLKSLPLSIKFSTGSGNFVVEVLVVAGFAVVLVVVVLLLVLVCAGLYFCG